VPLVKINYGNLRDGRDSTFPMLIKIIKQEKAIVAKPNMALGMSFISPNEASDCVLLKTLSCHR